MPTPFDQLTWQFKQFGNETSSKVTDALSAPDYAAMQAAQNTKQDFSSTYTLTAKGAGTFAAAPTGQGGYVPVAAGTVLTAATSGGLGGFEKIAVPKYTSPGDALANRTDTDTLVARPAGYTLAGGGLGGYERKPAGAVSVANSFEITKTAGATVAGPYADSQAVLIAQSKHRDAIKDQADSIANRGG